MVQCLKMDVINRQICLNLNLKQSFCGWLFTDYLFRASRMIVIVFLFSAITTVSYSTVIILLFCFSSPVIVLLFCITVAASRKSGEAINQQNSREQPNIVIFL